MKTWDDWQRIHQPYELRYHQNEGIAWCSDDEQFTAFWAQIFEFIGVEGKCLDVGCGPRPPFGPGSTAVDPLASYYQSARPEWWKGVVAYYQVAERLIPDLTGEFQTVMCWNCLDHTIGWRQILQNLKAYGAKDATYAIATDFNPPSEGHPGFDRSDFFSELEKHFEIQKYAENFQERGVALVMR